MENALEPVGWRWDRQLGDQEAAEMRNDELMLELRQAQWEEVCLGGRSEGEDKDDLEDGHSQGLGLGQLDKWWRHQGY